MSHDPSEIILICWFGAQETFLIIINVDKFFVDLWHIFQVSLMNRKLKKQHLFEIWIFCNIINIFNVTLDHLNAYNHIFNLHTTYV